MEKVKLRDLMARIIKDQRMLHSHLCLYTALLSLREKSNYSTPVRISRKELILLSKIKSTATYHKCMAQLVCYEYIIYQPSYDYFKGSQVTLLLEELT